VREHGTTIVLLGTESAPDTVIDNLTTGEGPKASVAPARADRSRLQPRRRLLASGKLIILITPASWRIACRPFVTLYRLHIRLVPYRHMPRIRAPTSTRTPWPAGRVALCAAKTGQVVAVKRWRMLLGTKRVRDA
jgi:hypothetical protein